MALISVIIPVYKVEAYLCRCVDSVLKQSFEEFDVILVDDGSPDDSGNICDRYAARDPRVHVIHQENGGLSAARNAGIEWALEFSDSQWLTFIDSDDWVHPLYLEALLDAANQNETEVSSCSLLWTHGEPLRAEPDIRVRVVTAEDYFLSDAVNATVACGKLYKKDCFQTVRYPVGRIHEDEYTTYRILFQHKHVAVIDVPLYAYFQNASGITHSEWSPRKLDKLEALEGQVSYFYAEGCLELSRRRCQDLLYHYVQSIDSLHRSAVIPESEKRETIKKLRKRLRGLLREYRGLKLASLWDRGNNLFAYATAYTGIRVLYRIWKALKMAGQRLMKKQPR